MSAARPKIELIDVDVRFDVGSNVITALEGYSLDIREGEFVAILGPSGCGKSTSLNLLAGFDKATSGQVLLNGQPISRPGPDRGVVFQNANLLPWLNVWENVVFGPKVKGMSERQYRERAEEMLALVKLDGFEKHLPGQLSGGMQQRASIARALAFDADLLLMDEPFGALDEIVRDHLNGQLLELWARTGKTICRATSSAMAASRPSSTMPPVAMVPRTSAMVLSSLLSGKIRYSSRLVTCDDVGLPTISAGP